MEQQYAKAVVIVLKTRAYVNTISQELNLAMSRTAAPAGKNFRNAAAANQVHLENAAEYYYICTGNAG